MASARAWGSEPYALSYVAPASCPNADAFATDVAKRVQNAAAGQGAQVAVTIREHAGRFVCEIIVVDALGETGRRDIDGATCPEVEQASAFFTGLAIDLGGRIAEAEEPAPVPPAAAAPKVVPRPAKPPAPSSPPERRAPRNQSVQRALRAALGARTGLGPGVRSYAELGGWLGSTGPSAFAPAVGLSLVAARSTIAGASGDAELALIAGRIGVSLLRLSAGPVTLRPVLALEVGPTFARGIDVRGPRSDTTLYASAEAILEIRWSVTRHFFVELGLAPTFPLRHTHYLFLPEIPVYTLPNVAARAALGAGWAF